MTNTEGTWKLEYFEQLGIESINESGDLDETSRESE